MSKNELTTENLKKKFPSQFELVNYAIRLAANMIQSGRGPRVKTEIQNRSLQILEEISTGKDEFDEISVHKATIDETSFQEAAKEAKAFSSEKKTERKGASALKMQDPKKTLKAAQPLKK